MANLDQLRCGDQILNNAAVITFLTQSVNVVHNYSVDYSELTTE